MFRARLAVSTALATFALTAPAAQAKPPSQAEPQAQRTVEVQILGLNETHGQLVPLRRAGRLAGGAATLAAYLEREEAENPRRTLIVDSGDFMQGPPISSFFEGASTVEAFNAIGVDAVAVGTTSSTGVRTRCRHASGRRSSRSWPSTSVTRGPASSQMASSHT